MLLMMLQKKIHSDGGENHDAGKKDDTTTTVVLKVDMHCEGCASKIVKNLRAFKGFYFFLYIVNKNVYSGENRSGF